MGLTVSQPTANQAPDATLGGSAVTTPSNTGHASTVTAASGGANGSASCRWFTFQAVGGFATAITLKITHTSQGALSGPTPTNALTVSYTLNGGGAWVDAVTRSNFTAAQGPTVFSVGLSAAQDISQVQVRVFYQVDAPDIGDSASVTATISDINLEVQTADLGGVIVIM